MAALQEALIASEEKRLSVSRALLDFKMEHNEALESNERIQYDLTEKILELEARLAQSIVNKARFWFVCPSMAPGLPALFHGTASECRSTSRGALRAATTHRTRGYVDPPNTGIQLRNRWGRAPNKQHLAYYCPPHNDLRYTRPPCFSIIVLNHA
jgi:hypothetical protein